MRIAALDLMPLFWCLGILLSVAVAALGEIASMARTVPAAVAALVLYFLSYPPRVQVLAFLALYGLCAFIFGLLFGLSKRAKKRKNFKNPLDKGEAECYNDESN